MPPAVSSLVQRLGAAHWVGWRDAWRIVLIASLHLASLAIMAFTEADIVAKLAFLLAWGILNFFWLGVTRRPAVSAGLSLMMIVILVLVSRLKYDIIWMTANFLDVMIIDNDTISFLLSIVPGLTRNIVISVAVVLPLVVLLWRLDTFRMRLRTSAVGFGACLVGIAAISFAQPQEDWETFLGGSYVSKFARSGVTAISELMLHGYMESDAVVTDQLKLLPDATCVPAQKPPHIIIVHDESSFDIRVAPGIKVPEGYGSHFLSFDGKARHFVVEGAGGPSWYTEYNVLARPVGALVREVLLLRDSDRGRASRARAADCVAPLRLPHPLDLPGARRFHERAQLPGRHRDAEFPRPEVARDQPGRARPVLL